MIPEIQELVDIAEAAGKAIMDVYSRNDPGTTLKDDRSPLTMADLLSERVIHEGLGKISPALPVISEEAGGVPYEERKVWRSYWLVDPLDGTKEFIKRNGEFTVNIALIEDNEPVIGVVHAPAYGLTYYAKKGKGAFRKEEGKGVTRINVSETCGGRMKLVASRSHAGEGLASILNMIGDVEYVSKGSSLKLCIVAEGGAHLYPRLAPTMEWDTAAGQCIVEESGGLVSDMSGKRLRYNRENMLNPHFVAACCSDLLNKVL